MISLGLFSIASYFDGIDFKMKLSYPCLMQNARSRNPLPPPYYEHRKQRKWLTLCLPEGNPDKDEQHVAEITLTRLGVVEIS